MSGAREAMLQRIRQALDTARAEDETILREYQQVGEKDRAAVVAQFVERVEDYKATVIQTTEAALPATMSKVCAERQFLRVAAPGDLPQAWLPSGMEVLRDDPPLSYEALDGVNAVLTGCRLGIAQTGTIVLDGGVGQGRRALSLIPDAHLCIVEARQIVDLVPEAITALHAHATRPITFISGPSATSDIELSRVEGVHGPRTLIVLLLTDKD
ncbi:MAG TPA: lactate utilization protein C [Ktedonobacterales bacterium]|nr:lactate utilization protein C [Ktedonobacterales bacterium]